MLTIFGKLGWLWLPAVLLGSGGALLWWTFHHARLDNAYLVLVGIILVWLGTSRLARALGWRGLVYHRRQRSDDDFDLFDDRRN